MLIFSYFHDSEAYFGRQRGKSEGQVIGLQIKRAGCCGQHLMKRKKECKKPFIFQVIFVRQLSSLPK